MNLQGLFFVLTLLASSSWAEQTPPTNGDAENGQDQNSEAQQGQVNQASNQSQGTNESKGPAEMATVAKTEATSAPLSQLLETALDALSKSRNSLLENKGGALDKYFTQAQDVLIQTRSNSRTLEATIGMLQQEFSKLLNTSKSGTIPNIVREIRTAHLGLEKSIREMSKDVDNLKIERSKMVAIIESLRRETQEVYANVQMSEAEKKIMQQDKSNLEATLANLKHQQASLQRESADLAQNLKTNQEMREQTQSEIEKVKAAIDGSDKDNKFLMQDNSNKRREVLELQKKRDQVKREYEAINAKLNDLDTEKGRLQGLVIRSTQEAANISGEIKALELSIAGYNLDAMKDGATIEQIKQANADVISRISMLRAQQKTLAAQLDKEKKEHQTAQRQIMTIQNEIKVSKDQENALSDSVNKMTQTIATTKEQVTKLTELATQLTTEKQEQNNKLGALQRDAELKNIQHKTALDDLKLLQSKISQLEKDERTLTSQLREMQRTLANTVNRKAKARREELSGRVIAVTGVIAKAEAAKAESESLATRAALIRAELEAMKQAAIEEENETNKLVLQANKGRR